MRSSAQLKDGHLRSLMHGPHPDDMHEPSGFFQAVGFENDVPYPEWGSKILVGHLCSSGIMAPNDELERPRAPSNRRRGRTLPQGARGASHFRCHGRSKLLLERGGSSLISPSALMTNAVSKYSVSSLR